MMAKDKRSPNVSLRPKTFHTTHTYIHIYPHPASVHAQSIKSYEHVMKNHIHSFPLFLQRLAVIQNAEGRGEKETESAEYNNIW